MASSDSESGDIIRSDGVEPVVDDNDMLEQIFHSAVEEFADTYQQNSSARYHQVLGDDEDDDEEDSDSEFYPLYEEDDDDDEDVEFHDADEGLGNLEVLIQETDEVDEDDEDDEMAAPNAEDEDDEDDDEENTHTIALNDINGQVLRLLRFAPRNGIITSAQLRMVLRSHGLGHILVNDGDEIDDIPDTRRRGTRDPDRFPKIPSEKGRELMDSSGVFGASPLRVSNSASPKKAIARRILDRELGLGSPPVRRLNHNLMQQSLIPTSTPEMVVRYDYPVYSGQFSDDGNFFFAVGKDFYVRMYDTANPYDWRHYKTVHHPFGQWTLSDASLSPDNKWLAYTSLQPHVCLAPTDPNDEGDPYTLDLSSPGTGSNNRYHHRSFAIWSVRFSGDGRELVAGTNASTIIVYDIESRTVLHNVVGHHDDVNAVCFADKQSPHILYSGSDDATIKVWDRRSIGNGKPVGAFVGHCEGLTCIDSKGDGRYILSNGKDQTMKLWDLRMVMSTERYNEANPTRHTRYSDYDYRDPRPYNMSTNWFKHPDDNSVVTFMGHKVQRTLIRCHFSPPGSTDSRYVYSGSYDGKVYIYNMDATLAGTIDVRNETMGIPAFRADQGEEWKTCLRDAAWHPQAPMIVASAWGGSDYDDFGMCSVHSWNEHSASEDEGEPRMGRVVDEKLGKWSRRSIRGWGGFRGFR